MSSLDADLVRRWFRRVRDRAEPVVPEWRIVPTPQEDAVLSTGAELVEASVVGTRSGSDWTDLEAGVTLTELPARMLHRYLDAMAAGIASARHAFAAPDVGVAPGSDVGAIALVAGLNAGAAALYGEIIIEDRPTERRTQAEPSAAEAARLAGFAAAELVVNGAGLHEVAAAAAAAAGGWRAGVPDHPAQRVDYRTRGLVTALLVALEIQTRDPEPPAEPASCGALPGENLGRSFTAEITFTMGLAPAEIRSLTEDLRGLAAEITVWPGGQWPHFHVHSDRPGAVIAQVYAYGTPFDLQITDHR